MVSPLLSIITVTADCESPQFAATAESLRPILNQSGIEWIVIPSREANGLAARVLPPISDGIYAAMNAGIEAARGDYLWFLNGGDRLSSEDVVNLLLRVLTKEQPDFVYGDSREFDETQPQDLWAKPARSHQHWRLGMFTHHQAMVYRRRLLPEPRYPEAFDVAADYGFTLLHLNAAKTVRQLSVALSDVSRGGFSTRHQDRGRLQQHQLRCQVGHVPRPVSIAISSAQRFSQTLRHRAPSAWQRLRAGSQTPQTAPR